MLFQKIYRFLQTFTFFIKYIILHQLGLIQKKLPYKNMTLAVTLINIKKYKKKSDTIWIYFHLL